jgi:magnesium transporter
MFTNCFLHSKPIVKVADSRQSIPMNPTYKAQAYQYSQDFFAVKTGEATDFANEFNLDLLDADNVYWLNFHNLDDRSSIEKLGQKIGLDKLSIESIFLPLRRAKVEEYPNYLFFQLHTLRNNSQDTEQTDQITFVLGEHYLLSFQTNEGQHFGEVRERIEKSKGKIRNKKADFLLFRLLDTLLDELFQYTIEVSDEIDRIDERIHAQMESDLLREIELQKRQLINLRKIVQPIKDLLAVLESMDNALIASTNKHYYKNLRNSCVSLLEDIDAHKQILEGLANLYYAVQGQRMNHIMKVLTVVSSIFIPLTFIVGVYGMNFKHMPELDYPYGYYTVVGFMFVLSFSLLLFFMKRGWLKRD